MVFLEEFLDELGGGQLGEVVGRDTDELPEAHGVLDGFGGVGFGRAVEQRLGDVDGVVQQVPLQLLDDFCVLLGEPADRPSRLRGVVVDEDVGAVPVGGAVRCRPEDNRVAVLLELEVLDDGRGTRPVDRGVGAHDGVGPGLGGRGEGGELVSPLQDDHLETGFLQVGGCWQTSRQAAADNDDVEVHGHATPPRRDVGVHGIVGALRHLPDRMWGRREGCVWRPATGSPSRGGSLNLPSLYGKPRQRSPSTQAEGTFRGSGEPDSDPTSGAPGCSATRTSLTPLPTASAGITEGHRVRCWLRPGATPSSPDRRPKYRKHGLTSADA